MNDKIQFRAWDEKQKYMAYQGDPDLETLQSFIHHYGDKELMQWTGFCDCNGKKVYDGDFVIISCNSHSDKLGKAEGSRLAKIQYCPRSASFKIASITGLVWQFDDTDFNNRPYRLKVVGNIKQGMN
jgi:hypothetical protein